jgi:hypothetical protein
MAVELAMKFRMSRRLVLLNVILRSGVVKFKSGGGVEAARARSRSCWICGFGRAASTRSRIVLSISATLTLIRRLVGSCSDASLYSPSAASSWSCPSYSFARSRWARDAASIARCRAILYSALSGAS